jgi:dTDP-4-dehydrorhamnose reductase
LQPVNTYAWSKLGGECVAQSYASSLIVRGSWYQDLTLTAASTDGYTSKVPVEKAAGWVAALSTSTVTGVVNVGGERRSLYEIAIQFNPKCRPITRAEVQLPYPVPRDSSLDCTRLHALVGF